MKKYKYYKNINHEEWYRIDQNGNYDYYTLIKSVRINKPDKYGKWVKGQRYTDNLHIPHWVQYSYEVTRNEMFMICL